MLLGSMTHTVSILFQVPLAVWCGGVCNYGGNQAWLQPLRDMYVHRLCPPARRLARPLLHYSHACHCYPPNVCLCWPIVRWCRFPNLHICAPAFMCSVPSVSLGVDARIPAHFCSVGLFFLFSWCIGTSAAPLMHLLTARLQKFPVV